MCSKKEILKAIGILEILERAADKCDSAWEKDPENKEAERAFDEAYQAQWNQNEKCAQMIHEFSGKAIDLKSARQLISKKHRQRIIEIIRA